MSACLYACLYVNIVVLAPDVAEFFPDSESVSAAVRTRRRSPKERQKGRCLNGLACRRIAGQRGRTPLGNAARVLPSGPGAPRFARTGFQARSMLAGSTTASIRDPENRLQADFSPAPMWSVPGGAVNLRSLPVKRGSLVWCSLAWPRRPDMTLLYVNLLRW